MGKEEEFSYQKTDARLETGEEDSGFELLRLTHEGNVDAIRKMGAADVLSILLSLLSSHSTGFELRSGSRKEESMLVAHLRDYIQEVRGDSKKGWHKPLLSFMSECEFSHAEVRAILNANFYWDNQSREEMDAAARAIGAPPIFAGHSPHEAGNN